MNRLPRLVFALLTPFVLAWSATAHAASCTNGNAIYHFKQAGVDVSCSQSSCHGNNPSGDKNNIKAGAASPGTIDNALDSVADMSGLREFLSLDAAALDDLAEYIFFAGGGNACPVAAAVVSANPTSAAFGNQNVGTASASQTITISNTGGAASSSLTYPAAPTHFSKSGTCANGVLAAGASCTVVFTFSPTAAGSFTPTYTISGTGVSVPIALSGTGVGASAPNVSATPTSLAFGTINVGSTSSAQTITVSNTGTGAASNMSYPAAPAKFTRSGSCGSATLAAGSSCTVTFTYTPTAAMTDNATYTITGGGATIPVSLSGTGAAAAPAALQLLPSTLSFGSVTVGATSATKSVTVTNSGGTAATGVSLANSNAAEFVVSGNTCGATLAAGAVCGFDVAYKPAAAGSDAASVTITSSAPQVVVSLIGTGAAAAVPNLAVSPATLAFGSITLGATAPAKTVTVTNSGGAAASGLAVANSNAARFPVSANTCGATLAAGASCTLNVVYTPAAAGADSATLTVSSTGGSDLAVALSGTGTAAATPNLQATPAPVAFGNVTVGQTSAPTTITINNSGAAAATSVALTNSNAVEFAVSNNTCGATIANGASCTLAVTYAPSAAGADSATLTVNYAGGGALSIALSGTGVAVTPPPGSGQLSFAAADTFADQNVGTTSAGHAIALSNVGSAAVVVSGITSSNPGEFTVSASSCGTVNAGAACSFTLTFTPAAAGSRSATITIASNGAGSPQALMATGNGVGSGVPPPVGGTTATAIEYYHAGFDHYFMTHIADEITKLDNGTFVGWTRTGKSFKVHATAAAGLNTVCRFFSTAFGAKSSHFYTPDAPECGVVKASPAWTFEAEVFHVVYPAFDGSCPAATIPVYRMYNDGQGGAPNHRYTTEMAVRNAMLALGWIAEGAGTIGVIMCSPQ